MDKEKNFYDILEVAKGASKEEIKAAFVKKAKQTHPDVCKDPDATEKFQEVNKAYETLRDERKRRMYDTFGSESDRYHSASQQAQNQSGFNPFGGGFGFDAAPDIEDIIKQFTQFHQQSDGGNDFFSQGQQQQHGPQTHQYSPHVEIEQVIEFHEAVIGVKKEIKYKVIHVCDHCNGTGAEKPTDLIICDTCKGHGRVVQKVAFFQVEQICPKCHGQGKSIKTRCYKCFGNGVITKEEKRTVNFPKGVFNKVAVQYAGYGNYIAPHQRGSLIVHCIVKSSKVFMRNGNDLIINVPVKYYDAIMGISLLIPTLTTPTKIKIPPNTKDNKSFRLAKRGMPVLNQNNVFGNLIINVKIVYPTKLQNKEKTFLQKIKQNDDPNFYDAWLVTQEQALKKKN